MKFILDEILKYSVLSLMLLITSGVMAQDSDTANKIALQQKEDRPNVIVVMTDDQGYGELSYHGNPILKTPNLDQLAGQSLRFTDFHVSSVCTPTRGQLLTGLDAARNGAVNVSSGRTLLRSDLPTMADFFAKSGYRTGIFGKWHLGDNYPYRPEDRGFDETIWFPSSHINSVSDYWGNDYFDDVYIHNGSRERFKGYSTDVFFDRAMDWMKAQAKAGQPFFTYLPTNTPHQPYWAPKEDIKAIEEAFAASEFSKMEQELKEKIIRYLAMIRNIDTNMGKLDNFLKKEGLSNSTILIFTNDNGSTFAPYYYNAGMRGRKAQLWEGGHRVSFFIRLPHEGLGDPHGIDGLTQIQDVLPTLLDLCGIVPSTPPKFDGISLAPVLYGSATVPEERMLIVNYSRMPHGFDYPSPASPSIMRREEAAVLWKRWRLLRENELYNLVSDPMQQTNVINQHPEIAKKMRDHLNSWWAGVSETVNEPQAVTIGSDAENPVKLTSVEWLDVFVDLQWQIRQGVRKNGYWVLNVEEAGEYEFELRRWPRETELALAESLPSSHVRDGDDFLTPGVALPISAARIFISGVKSIKEAKPTSFSDERKVRPGDKSVTFTTNLEAGSVRLHTWFDDKDGQPISGAYYVYVRRK